MTTLQIFMFFVIPPALLCIVYRGRASDRRKAKVDRYIERCRRTAAEERGE